MSIFILSLRELISLVSLDPILELEDLLVDSCDAKILTPIAKPLYKRTDQLKEPKVRELSYRIIKNSLGLYRLLDLHLDSNETNILIVITIYGAQLDILSSIPNWRKRFDVVVAYVFDSWRYERYSKNVKYLDRLFVALPEVMKELKQGFGIPVSLIPFGADVLTHGSDRLNRPIDLLNFGRIPHKYNSAFINRFDSYDSEILYYRSVARRDEQFPQTLYQDRVDRRDVGSLFNLLRKSKLVLAFDTLYPGMRQFPYSFVTLRWFYGLATGCVVVGKAPTTPFAKELLNWENATIELPEDPQESCEFIEELLQDKLLLHSLHRTNYRQALARHDWRYRIRDMFEALDLPIPEKLSQQLLKVKAKVKELSS